MKVQVILIVILVLLLAVGCDSRKGDKLIIPTAPEDVTTSLADKVLYFSPGYDEDGKLTGQYNISMINTDDHALVDTSEVFTITISFDELQFSYHSFPMFFRGWTTDSTHALNPNQEIILKKNGTVILDTFINPVAIPDVIPVAEYDVTQEKTINWSLDSNSQYQFAIADAYDDGNEGGYGPYSEYAKQISPAARSFTFPANAITLLPDSQTSYGIGVEQLNYKIKNKIAVMVYSSGGCGFSNWHKAGRFIPSDRILQINNTLTRMEN